MGKHDPAYALACGIAVGSLLMIGLGTLVQERRVQQAISRTETPLISRINHLEARHAHISEQLDRARAEARDKALAEQERDNQARAADAWKAQAFMVAMRWELAFMKFENDRQTARWAVADERERLWLEQNPADKIGQTIRPAEARQLVGNGPIRDWVERLQ
jgi:hypothetical protein